jgi:hypothetical protein
MLALLQFTALFMMAMNSLTIAQGLLKDIFASVGPVLKIFAASVKPTLKAAIVVITYWLVVYKFVKKAIADVKPVRVLRLATAMPTCEPD